MKVSELNRDQLVQLKQKYLAKLDEDNHLNAVLYDKPEWDKDGEHRLSWGELAIADELISDEVVFDYYSSYNFTEDDFSE